MLSKTHFVMSLFAGLILISFARNPFVFLIVVIVSTFLPDLDSYNSKLGRRFFSRVLTVFTKHRGIMHSLFFLVAVYLLLYFYAPVFSFGFLVGYGAHLIGDLFTKQGLRIFYPFKLRVKGFVKTGGWVEDFIFVGFSIADVSLMIKLALSI